MPEPKVKYKCGVCSEKVEGADDIAEHVYERHRTFFLFVPQVFVDLPMEISHKVSELIISDDD